MSFVMNIERWILVGIIGASILAVWLLIPKKKAREAWVLFLFLHIITWPAGLLPVQMGWIDYPVQLLPNINEFNRTSFTFEFYLFPVVAIIFSLYFPESLKWKGALLYYLLFSGFFTGMEVIIEKPTDLVQYHEWKWYWTLITVMISLYLNNSYYKWYKKKLVE